MDKTFPEGAEPPTDGERDPLDLVARVAEALPRLDAAQLDRLAAALDELNEAVGLRLDRNNTDAVAADRVDSSP